MRKQISLFFSIALVSIILTSCATIIHGTSQTVAISSNPTNAKVFVDGQETGITPVNVDLKRKDSHTVRIELDGYSPYEINLNRKVDAWIAGNIVFGGIIGLAVDAISGGMYKLSPEEIMAEMKTGTNTAHVYKKDDVIVFVTLTPSTHWTIIGSLQHQ